jgi:ferredoxin-NADP reductase
VDVLRRNLPDDYADCTYFLCGPLPMITAVEKALDELKIAPKKVHSEQYEMA